MEFRVITKVKSTQNNSTLMNNIKQYLIKTFLTLNQQQKVLCHLSLTMLSPLSWGGGD